jgi:hypothetical protein
MEMGWWFTDLTTGTLKFCFFFLCPRPSATTLDQTNSLQPAPGSDYLAKLAERLGQTWPAVFRARENARSEQTRLRDAITGLKPPANDDR